MIYIGWSFNIGLNCGEFLLNITRSNRSNNIHNMHTYQPKKKSNKKINIFFWEGSIVQGDTRRKIED